MSSIKPKDDLRASFRTNAEVETVRKVLDMVGEVAAKREKEGFGNAYDFTIGVLNCFLISFVFGMFPEHFWILYVIEGFYLLPFKLYLDYNAKPLNEVLFHLDYCWMMNTVALFVFVTVGLLSFQLESDHTVGDDLRKKAFLSFMGTTGVLMGATAALPFVALFFHNVRAMAGLFIHLFPPLMLYTFHWHSDLIKEAWPNVFDLSYMDDIRFFPESGPFFLPGTALDTVAGASIALYFLWFVPYVSWMVLVGLDLPRKNRKNGKPPRWDTVFHSTVRDGLCITIGKVCWGRKSSVSKKQMENDDYELRDFLAYMAFHAFMAYSAIYTLAYPCFKSKLAHQIFLVLLTVVCVHRGAIRYKFYVTGMYERAIRKEFASILVEDTKASEK